MKIPPKASPGPSDIILSTQGIVRYLSCCKSRKFGKYKKKVTVSGVSNDMKLSDKLAMLRVEAKDVEQVELKMGEKFSLYEARKQCFNEMCKIPVLEIDVYGPVREEINIAPKLFIDTETPSYTMIAWQLHIFVTVKSVLNDKT